MPNSTGAKTLTSHLPLNIILAASLSRAASFFPGVVNYDNKFVSTLSIFRTVVNTTLLFLTAPYSCPLNIVQLLAHL